MITEPVTDVFLSLDKGAVALASSRRLARQLAQRYADWKTASGELAWPTPGIRVLDDWLVATWQGHIGREANAPRLLNDEQEQLLWEQVIRRGVSRYDSAKLVQLASTARVARRSWRKIHEWRIDWDRLREFRSADTEAFLSWAGLFRESLRDNNWLTVPELPALLVDRPAWVQTRAQPEWWLGFDAMPPALGRLMDALRAHGCPQRLFRNAGFSDSPAAVVECVDTEQEWHRIARWARTELSENPDSSLGVVCPDLHDLRDRVADILDDVLHPDLAWRVDAPRIHHISLGRPLTEYPMVSAAVDLLQWTRSRIPFEVISRTLLSPYTGDAGTRMEARAQLEMQLRGRRQESFTLDTVRMAAERTPAMQRFSAALEVVSGMAQPGDADPAAWAARFSDWLQALGWPGERPLDSHEFQLLRAWREQLSRFAALGGVQSRWTLHEALRQLNSMSATRILQFHDDRAPLQIVGAQEASGLWFDRMWLAGMSDAVWPPPAQPDPFIPVSLQKAHGMPEASARAMLDHARLRTENLLASADRLCISFASREADAPLSLSPLFQDMNSETAVAAEVYSGRERQIAVSTPAMEFVDDASAPAPVSGSVAGGVGLVADQAQCPFRALAHHRLDVRDLPRVSPGLSNAERGILVHRVLKAVWDSLKDRDALNAMPAGELVSLVGECVGRVVGRQYADSAFLRRFMALERRRLEALVIEWLDLERRRDWFRVVATELADEVTLGGEVLSIRVDRVDEVADGRRLVIDYKTGRPGRVAAWTDPRMEEPQLPMYALGVGAEVTALVLAAVRRGECGMKGVIDPGPGGDGGTVVTGPLSLQPVPELGFAGMDGIKTWWQSALGSLVDEFMRGVAGVEPKDPRVCRSCDVMPLCRVFEGREPTDD